MWIALTLSLVSLALLEKIALVIPHELGHWAVRRFLLHWPASIQMSGLGPPVHKYTVLGVRLRLGRGWWLPGVGHALTGPWPLSHRVLRIPRIRAVVLLLAGASINMLEGLALFILTFMMHGPLRLGIGLWAFVTSAMAAGNIFPQAATDGGQVARLFAHPLVSRAVLISASVLILGGATVALVMALSGEAQFMHV